MAIARKALVWGLFAGGGTIAAFLFPALISLFLLVATNQVPDGLQFDSLRGFVSLAAVKVVIFSVISLALWHAAHRLRCVFHDFGVRKDDVVARGVYLVAAAGTLSAAFYLYGI